MSRKDNISQKIFSKLYEVAQSSDYYDERPRWLKLKGSLPKIENTFRVSHHVVSSIISINEKILFAISGIEIDSSIHNVEQINCIDSISDEVIAIVLADLDIPLSNKYTIEYITREVLSESKNTKNYTGHSIDKIKECFLPLKFFEISNSRLSISQITGMMLCRSKLAYLLPFDEITIRKFEDIFLCDNKMPFENLVYALHSVSWKHSFLEVYRGIENLYPFFAIKELAECTHKALNLDSKDISLTEFFRIIINELDYNGREEDILGKIISFTGLQNIFNELSTISGLPEKDYERLYKVRCSVVHFSISQRRVDIGQFKNTDWNVLIRGMLNIIEKMYVVSISDTYKSPDENTKKMLKILRSMIKK